MPTRWLVSGFSGKKNVKNEQFYLFGRYLVFGGSKLGDFYDLNDIETILKAILILLEETKIEHKGLFLNADVGFYSKKLK